MPNLRSKDKVLAVVCADLHLSLKPPLCRSGEKDWFGVMRRVLDEVHEIARANGSIPILCAGDVFDRWNSPPELINFALDTMEHQRVWAIPGQHDLPLHNYDQMERSAFYTLVTSHKMTLLEGGESYDRASISSAAWGRDIPPPPKTDKLKVILVHGFIWDKQEHGYTGAPELSSVKAWKKKLEGYDVAIFGDNHHGFEVPGKPFIFNCGTMMRRRTSELNYKPRVGLLMSDGTVKSHLLDISKDVFDAKVVDQSNKPDMREFLHELSSLGDEELDFKEAMKSAIRKRGAADPVRLAIIEAIEETER